VGFSVCEFRMKRLPYSVYIVLFIIINPLKFILTPCRSAVNWPADRGSH